MQIKILRIAGEEEALLGLSFSFKRDTDKMPQVAEKLKDRDNGENKFLESIMVWLDIQATRAWWSQFDTYRHCTKQSESTMHTLLSRELTKEDFDSEVDSRAIAIVNEYIRGKDLTKAKKNLPEGFLQRREICLSVKEIKHIVSQRSNHRFPEWLDFCKAMKGIKYV